MKAYEGAFHAHLVRRVPVIVRVDGRAFHQVTQGWPGDGPFSAAFIEAMTGAAVWLATSMQGFRLGYVQSDEASFLLTDYEKITTDAWFGYDLQKVASISAAEMTRAFNRWAAHHGASQGVFDARAFNVPREEVANYFLWRARDWSRNSVQMYARAFFSHQALYKKDRSAMHEMLHGIGKNWATDLPAQIRNGTWLVGTEERHDILPRYTDVETVVTPLLSPAAAGGVSPQP